MTGRGLNLAVSPYHLAAADPAAMAAVLLADRVTTFMPAPEGLERRASGGCGKAGRALVGQAVERSPRLLKLMEALRWTMPLWHEGVIAAGRTTEDVGADVRDAWSEIRGTGNG